MKISGLTVSVDYAPLLGRSLSVWRDTLDDLLVVTSSRDGETKELCKSAGVDWYETEAFYRDGAAFNKASAMAEGFYRLLIDDWVLFFDADVIPPENWRRIVEAEHPRIGYLYGARRKNERGRTVYDGEMAGYFHLFHSSDPRIPNPLFDSAWRHAGGYDSQFAHAWVGRQIWLPLTLTHIGTPGQNWWGKGGESRAEEMVRHRKRHGQIAPWERSDGKTRGWM